MPGKFIDGSRKDVSRFIKKLKTHGINKIKRRTLRSPTPTSDGAFVVEWKDKIRHGKLVPPKKRRIGRK